MTQLKLEDDVLLEKDVMFMLVSNYQRALNMSLLDSMKVIHIHLNHQVRDNFLDQQEKWVLFIRIYCMHMVEQILGLKKNMTC